MSLLSTLHRNRRIFRTTLSGAAWGLRHKRPELRHHVVREIWTLMKRYGAHPIENIELREIPALENVVAEGYVDDYQRLVIAALVRELGCETFFEIGTNRGRTTWTVARSNPAVHIYTLDLPPAFERSDAALPLGFDDSIAFRDPSCGEAFRLTPEAEHITQLWGDSATYDFAPYRGSMGFIYVDGAHTYDYVKADSRNAFAMLSDKGIIAWDDYTVSPGVYQHLIELANTLPHPVFHLLGTRLALYSSRPFVTRLPYDSFASLPTI